MDEGVETQYLMATAKRTKSGVAAFSSRFAFVRSKNAIRCSSVWPRHVLLEVLAGLERLYGALHNAVPPANPSARTIGKLLATVAKLSEPKRPDPQSVRRTTLRSGIELALAVLPTHSQSPPILELGNEVAILPAFQSVALSPERISARSIQGLVRSVHGRWDSVANSPSVGNLVVALTTYQTRNALLGKWRSGLQHVLNQEGPEYFAKIFSAMGSRGKLCKRLGVGTGYRIWESSAGKVCGSIAQSLRW